MTYENEFEEVESSSESGANEGASPEPEKESTSEASGQEAPAKQQQDSDEAKELPFHEHPRFKELIEQKNQAQATQKALEERYYQLQAQLNHMSQQPKTPVEAQKDELLEHLKTIDPRFAARFEQLTKTLPTVEALQQKIENYERQQVRTQAVNSVNSLHEQNKVSPELRQFINSQLDLMAMQGQLKSLEDVPTAYNRVHGDYKKFIEGIERTTRESYVTAKKADAKTPTSQPKGKPVSNGSQKLTFSKDPEVAKQQIVSRYLKNSKAAQDI